MLNTRYFKTHYPTHKFVHKIINPFRILNIISPTAIRFNFPKNSVFIIPFMYLSWNLTAPVYKKFLTRIKLYGIRNRLKLKIMKLMRLRIFYTPKGILLNT